MTVTEFSGLLSSLEIEGVGLRLPAFPQQVNTATLPMSYPRLPTVNQAVVTLGNRPGLLAMTLELVIILEAVGQNTNAANYTLALSVMDGAIAALQELALGGVVNSWDIVLNIEEYGTNKPFWTLVVRVTGSDV